MAPGSTVDTGMKDWLEGYARSSQAPKSFHPLLHPEKTGKRQTRWKVMVHTGNRRRRVRVYMLDFRAQPQPLFPTKLQEALPPGLPGSGRPATGKHSCPVCPHTRGANQPEVLLLSRSY